MQNIVIFLKTNFVREYFDFTNHFRKNIFNIPGNSDNLSRIGHKIAKSLRMLIVIFCPDPGLL